MQYATKLKPIPLALVGFLCTSSVWAATPAMGSRTRSWAPSRSPSCKAAAVPPWWCGLRRSEGPAPLLVKAVS